MKRRYEMQYSCQLAPYDNPFPAPISCKYCRIFSPSWIKLEKICWRSTVKTLHTLELTSKIPLRKTFHFLHEVIFVIQKHALKELIKPTIFKEMRPRVLSVQWSPCHVPDFTISDQFDSLRDNMTSSNCTPLSDSLLSRTHQ